MHFGDHEPISDKQLRMTYFEHGVTNILIAYRYIRQSLLRDLPLICYNFDLPIVNGLKFFAIDLLIIANGPERIGQIGMGRRLAS